VLGVDGAALRAVAGVAVAHEAIGAHGGLARVPEPRAADRVALEQVALDHVAEREGQLEAVRRRERQVVEAEHVVVAAATRVVERLAVGTGRPGHLPQRLLAREGEDAVPPVRDRVRDDAIAHALFEHQHAGGILPAVVAPVRVAADAMVEAVAGDRTARAAPQRAAPAREVGGVAAAHTRADRAVEHDPVLHVAREQAHDLRVASVAHREPGAVVREPLAAVVRVRPQPVARVLALPGRTQPLPEVVRHDRVLDPRGERAVDEDPDLEAADARCDEAVALPAHHDAGARVGVGEGPGRRAPQRARADDHEVVAVHVHDAVAVRVEDRLAREHETARAIDHRVVGRDADLGEHVGLLRRGRGREEQECGLDHGRIRCSNGPRTRAPAASRSCA